MRQFSNLERCHHLVLIKKSQLHHEVRFEALGGVLAGSVAVRAFLIEQGIAVRSGLRTLCKSLFAILEDRKDEIFHERGSGLSAA